MEDDKATRDFIATVLMYCVNRDVLKFENGLLAWSYIEAGNGIDIIVSDVEMPEMDGLALLKRVKAKYPDKICIVMSGDLEYQSLADRIGANAFLCKPFKVNDLFDVVARFVTGEGGS